MSRGLLGRNSPLHIRQDRKSALQEADVVIMGGMVADFRLNYGRSLSPKSKVIAVNRSQSQLLKNAKLFWNPELALQADVGQFFKELLSELQSAGYQAPKDWNDKLRKRDLEKEAKNAEMANLPSDKYLNPVKVLTELEESFSENSYIIGDGGDFVATAAYIVRPRGPLRWLDPGAFGTLGCGAGFALGVKCAKPDADVYCLFGDGSIGYSLIEFDTFNRHKLPITAIIGNDACWTQIAREQKPMLGSDVACRLEYTRYDKAAEGLGAVGMYADDKDKDNLQAIFAKAREVTRTLNKPVLLNVLIGKTKFRDGSISV
jgi:acetolactate synthase-like protein